MFNLAPDPHLPLSALAKGNATERERASALARDLQSFASVCLPHSPGRSQGPLSSATTFRPTNDLLPGAPQLCYTSNHKDIHCLICRDPPAWQPITIIRTRKTGI